MDDYKYNIGDKVTVLKIPVRLRKVLKSNTLVEIVDIYPDGNSRHDTYYLCRWFVNGYKFQQYFNEKILLDLNEPEKSNYEEWLEESKDYEFKVGDRVIGLGRVDDCNIKNQIGTVVDVKYAQNVGYDCSVQFDDPSFCDELHDCELGDGKNIRYFVSNRDIKLYDDEPEEQNYEEWLEESKKDEQIQDIIDMGMFEYEYRKPQVDEYLKKVFNEMDDDVFELYYDIFMKNITGEQANESPIFPKASRIITKFYDDFEDFIKNMEDHQNYEEWLEESKEFKFSIGDKVIISNPDYDYEKLGLKGKIGEVINIDRKTEEFNYDVKIIDGKIKMGAFNEYELTHLDSEPEESNYEEWNEHIKTFKQFNSIL